MQDLPPPLRAGIIPGKTFEYLASGTPILAAVPDGDARELLDACGTALLARPADVQGMATLIHSEIARRRRGEPEPPVRPEVLAPYERSALARALADVFDGVLGRRPALAAR
jgi:glycosyltransferase involved in cell wall biosynthesis